MTLKIERYADEQHTTLRLIGHLQAAYLEELQAQIEGNGPRTVLHLTPYGRTVLVDSRYDVVTTGTTQDNKRIHRDLRGRRLQSS